VSGQASHMARVGRRAPPTGRRLHKVETIFLQVGSCNSLPGREERDNESRCAVPGLGLNGGGDISGLLAGYASPG
jgi:hypothetical protein